MACAVMDVVMSSTLTNALAATVSRWRTTGEPVEVCAYNPVYHFTPLVTAVHSCWYTVRLYEVVSIVPYSPPHILSV